MKKVFIIHGFQGMPNGGWRPWLMGELEKKNIYACSLPMPDPEWPLCSEWVGEIERSVEWSVGDEVYLVGHSLGATAILRYLENDNVHPIQGAVLVAGPISKNDNRTIDNFLEDGFDFSTISSKCGRFAVIQGDDDPSVPMKDAERLSSELSAELTVVQGGKHLNTSAGWFELPPCLDALDEMMG